ncbi:MAG TPA: lysophospholipid acyltransferase family protein [Methylomirabilota bacterium]|nr:lysophospholipid acyltransferase family protein [Methylomirabilota bacterium]
MRGRQRVLTMVGPWAGALSLSLLARTLEIRREEGAVESRWHAGLPTIYAIWHGRLALMPWLYGRRDLHVLISRSRDGEIVAALIRRFGFVPVRGSSSRGGAQGFRELIRALAAGESVVIVPDGPRGPREVVKPGIVGLARLSGAAVVPVALGASSEWRLRSWDEFRIPKPFARCVVRFGEPIQIACSADRAQQDAARKDIESALRSVTWQVDEEAAR